MGLSAIAIDTGAEKKALCEKLGCAAWVDFKESKDIVAAYVTNSSFPHTEQLLTGLL